MNSQPHTYCTTFLTPTFARAGPIVSRLMRDILAMREGYHGRPGKATLQEGTARVLCQNLVHGQCHRIMCNSYFRCGNQGRITRLAGQEEAADDRVWQAGGGQ